LGKEPFNCIGLCGRHHFELDHEIGLTKFAKKYPTVMWELLERGVLSFVIIVRNGLSRREMHEKKT
jgi:hypothetical protein